MTPRRAAGVFVSLDIVNGGVMAIEERTRLREESARLVMGWRPVRIPWAYSGVADCWENSDDIPVMTCHAWRPDEDDTQCMRVVDRMVELGFVCSLVIEPGRVGAAFGNQGVLPSPLEHPDRRIGLLRAAVDAMRD